MCGHVCSAPRPGLQGICLDPGPQRLSWLVNAGAQEAPSAPRTTCPSNPRSPLSPRPGGTPIPSPALPRDSHSLSALSVLSMHAKSLQSCPTFGDPVDHRVLCPWDSPGKNIGMGYPFLFQMIFLTLRLNPRLLCLLRWQTGSLPLGPPGQCLVMGPQISRHGLGKSGSLPACRRGWNKYRAGRQGDMGEAVPTMIAGPSCTAHRPWHYCPSLSSAGIAPLKMVHGDPGHLVAFSQCRA